MSQTITFPAPPTGGYFSGEHAARRVRRAQHRATALVAGEPVAEYVVDIPERTAYVEACVAVVRAAPSSETVAEETAPVAPVKARKQPSKPVAAFANVTLPPGALCTWKSSGELCGQPVQDGFRFCAKHVTMCEKRGYPERALPRASKAS